jgi:hypothetical protein
VNLEDPMHLKTSELISMSEIMHHVKDRNINIFLFSFLKYSSSNSVKSINALLPFAMMNADVKIISPNSLLSA